jgi:hypothetical protein
VTIHRFSPVRKHNRDRTNYLHTGIESRVLVNPKLGIPTVLLYLPEKLIASHHFGKSFFMMLQINEISIAEFVGPVRQLFG